MTSAYHFPRMKRGLFMVGLAATLTTASATINFSVTFDDPGAANAASYAEIESNVLAAGNLWAGYLADSANLEVQISFGDVPTANGGSVTTGFVETAGGLDIYEQGAAYELRTGIDPNDNAPDIKFTIGTTYLAENLWFDPNPTARVDPVPVDRTDAVSVFTHEFGHAFAFNGFRDYNTAALPSPGTYESTFDRHIVLNAGVPYFDGVAADALYGGPVP